MAVQAAQDAGLKTACHIAGGIGARKKADGPLAAVIVSGPTCFGGSHLIFGLRRCAPLCNLQLRADAVENRLPCPLAHRARTVSALRLMFRFERASASADIRLPCSVHDRRRTGSKK
jgi:hypothetical protein